MEPTNDTPAPVRSARAEKHRLYMQTYNKRYIRKSEAKRSVEAVTYESLYKLAKETADRKAANGGSLKRENGVLTTKSSIAFKEYIKRHNRKSFIAYIDADLKDKFAQHCKANGLSSARVLEELLTDYFSKG
jgi:hypothetical protein